MTAPNSVTYNYDNIATTTLALIRRNFADAIFKANPTIAWFLGSGRIRLESGGRWIEEPIIYSKNDTVKAYRGWDPLNVAPTDELTMARYNWRQVATSIAISGLEELENDGPAAIFDNLAMKIRIAEMSMKEHFDEKIHAATASKDLSRDFLGIQEIVENAPQASQGTLGGINKTTNKWWANQHFIAKANLTPKVADRELSKNMIRQYQQVSRNLEMPTIIISGPDMYGFYEQELHDLARFPAPRSVGALDIGFPNQTFKGIPWFYNEILGWEEGADDDVDRKIWMLNDRYLNFVIHRRRNFSMSKFKEPHNQDGRIAQILFAGQMTCNNCNRQSAGDYIGIVFNEATSGYIEGSVPVNQ